MTEKQKIKRLARLWCDWNREKIDGDTFAYKVGHL